MRQLEEADIFAEEIGHEALGRAYHHFVRPEDCVVHENLDDMTFCAWLADDSVRITFGVMGGEVVVLSVEADPVDPWT